MKKRYLKTVEDVIALKDTDTKIYRDLPDFKDKEKVNYYKFVNGVLCWFEDEENAWTINAQLYHNNKFYILEEGEEQEVTEATYDDIGKLCWFYDTYNRKVVGKLREVLQDNNFPFRSDYGIPSVHCRPLTKDEIKEFMEKAE